MKAKHLNKFLNLSVVERKVINQVFVSTTKRKILLIILPLISIFLLTSTFVAIFANIRIFNIFYKYAINLPLGNLVFLVSLLLMVWWIILLLQKRLSQNAYSWFNKTKKISYATLKKVILKAFFYLFVIVALADHIIFYFYNQTNNLFEFKFSPESVLKLYQSGFWNNLALSELATFNFKHIGFLFEPVFNLFYLFGFTWFGALGMEVLLTIFFVLDIYYLSLRKKPFLKLRKLTLPEYVQKIQNDTEIIPATNNFNTYIDFLFNACRYLKINYQELSLFKIEKLVKKRLKTKKDINLIINPSHNDISQNNSIKNNLISTNVEQINTNINNEINSKSQLLFNTEEFEFDDNSSKK
ncbi:hypothetical protein NPA08_03530 [Mycoplasmopsis citelli]|uniref:hypothetical protein n=1 Tax=Mycoplasmopsis citelli TaxID=171281 RepID=UPI0021159410|nr:hypothetical protein [Mycoplasmopsis citelli]UUD36002.1 hypothetical protein NPA08_03530 [Mycoplasmopsis citelli]